jgi:hypothetical protein
MDLVQHGGGRARLMLNQGDGTFERDMGFDAASNDQELSAWGDADNDGDLDVVIGPIDKAIVINRLHLKSGFLTSGLRVRVLDEDGHMTCYGATVRLKQIGGVPGTTQTRIVDGGSGYLSQNEYTVTFGGVGSGRYELEVIYPSPAGSRVVVDGRSDPRLWSLEPGTTPGMAITVYRDGRVVVTALPTADVPLRPPPARLDRLGAPWPSPAHVSASIPVDMLAPGTVSLTIHDVRGRLVRRLVDDVLPAGRRTFAWDLTDDQRTAARTGIYFCRLLVDGRPTDARRLLVLR